MSEYESIVESGERMLNDFLDINEKYFPGSTDIIFRTIVCTILRETAREAYEEGRKSEQVQSGSA
jgi:hypothetical protein